MDTRARPRGLVLVPGDVLRTAACVSFVVALVWFGAVAAALLFLVLGGTMLARVLAVPSAFDLTCCTAILLAAWAAELDWYLAVGWLDVVVHAAVTGLVAALVQVALVQVGAVPAADTPTLSHPQLGSAVVTVAVGVALATWWEIAEWLGHTFLDNHIQVGYTDTIGDLAAGVVGSLVAGALVARGALFAGPRP